MPHVARNERLIDNGRPPPRTERTAACELYVHAENLAWAKAEIAKYPEGRQASAVIPILWRAQEQHGGWVSEAAIRAVADLLGMPYIRALEIATFYTMFQLQPVGNKRTSRSAAPRHAGCAAPAISSRCAKSRIHHEPFIYPRTEISAGKRSSVLAPA